METWEILSLIICQIIIQLLTLFKTGRFNAVIRNSLKTMVASGESGANGSLAQAIHAMATRIGDLEARINLSKRNRKRKKEKGKNSIPSESVEADLQHIQEFFDSVKREKGDRRGGEENQEEEQKEFEEEQKKRNPLRSDSGRTSDSKNSNDPVSPSDIGIEK